MDALGRQAQRQLGRPGHLGLEPAGELLQVHQAQALGLVDHDGSSARKRFDEALDAFFRRL